MNSSTAFLYLKEKQNVLQKLHRDFYCYTTELLLIVVIMIDHFQFIVILDVWRWAGVFARLHDGDNLKIHFEIHLRPTGMQSFEMNPIISFLIWTTIAIIVKLRYIASNYEYRLIYIFTVRGFQCNLNIKILINYLFSLSKDQLYHFFLFSKLLMRIFNFQLGKGGCQLHRARDNDLVNMKSCILIFSWLSLVLLSLSNKLARFPLRQI